MAQRNVEPPEASQPESKQSVVAVSSGRTAEQHTWRNIRLIIEREYKNRVNRRSFLIVTIILSALVALAAFIPTIQQYFSTRTHTQTQVVIVNSAGGIAGFDAATLGATINTDLNGTTPANTASYAVTFQPSSMLNSLQDQVKNGSLGVLLVLDRAANGGLQLTYYTDASPTGDGNLAPIQALAQHLTFLDTAQRLGLGESQIRSLLAPPNLSVVRTQPARSTEERVAGTVLAVFGSYLSFFAVVGYAVNVAHGVAEEKANRVMEILVNAATPFQLMIGKIVGIGAACLTQMAVVVAVGIGTLLLQTPLQTALFGTAESDFVQYLTRISIPFYLSFLIYFLLEFFMYASVDAGLGALVRRTEEVQSMTMIPTMFLVAGFLSIYAGLGSPDSATVRLFSYIPIFTPVLMLDRLALGTVAWWEIVLTIGLMLATIAVCIWVSARLYRYGVLMYGQRPSLGQLVKIIRTN